MLSFWNSSCASFVALKPSLNAFDMSFVELIILLAASLSSFSISASLAFIFIVSIISAAAITASKFNFNFSSPKPNISNFAFMLSTKEENTEATPPIIAGNSVNKVPIAENTAPTAPPLLDNSVNFSLTIESTKETLFIIFAIPPPKVFKKFEPTVWSVFFNPAPALCKFSKVLPAAPPSSAIDFKPLPILEITRPAPAIKERPTKSFVSVPPSFFVAFL